MWNQRRSRQRAAAVHGAPGAEAQCPPCRGRALSGNGTFCSKLTVSEEAHSRDTQTYSQGRDTQSGIEWPRRQAGPMGHNGAMVVLGSREQWKLTAPVGFERAVQCR